MGLIGNIAEVESLRSQLMVGLSGWLGSLFEKSTILPAGGQLHPHIPGPLGYVNGWDRDLIQQRRRARPLGQRGGRGVEVGEAPSQLDNEGDCTGDEAMGLDS